MYAGLYKWVDSQLTSVHEEMNISMIDWLEKLSEEGKEVMFLSPDIHLYKDIINEYLQGLAIFPEDALHIAKPSNLALAGMNRESDDTHSLVPNYLRLAQAEANWLKSQKEIK